MIATVIKAFAYLSAVIVSSLIIAAATMAFRGDITAQALQRAAAVLRGEESAPVEEPVAKSPYAGLSELQINPILREAIVTHEREIAQWRDRMIQEKALAESSKEAASRAIAELAAARIAAKQEADRLSNLLVQYNRRVVSKSMRETVAILQNMRPTDVVKTLSGWSDAEIARHLVPMDREFGARVMKQLNVQLGPARSGKILKEVEKQLEQPQAGRPGAPRPVPTAKKNKGFQSLAQGKERKGA